MSDEVYIKVAEAIDQGPQTAPRSGDEFSKSFIEHLKLLYTPDEADLVRHLRMGSKFTSAADLATKSGKTEEEVKALLDPLAAKGRIIGFGGMYTLLPVPLIFNYHQVQPEIGPDDMKAAELYQDYFIKEGFYRFYESSKKGSQIMRVIPVQRSVRHGQQILDTEEAHKIIDSVGQLRLVPCPCRTRAEKMGTRECKDDNPVASCIMMEHSAMYFKHIGLGKEVTADEAKKYFDEMQDLGLIGTTENYEDAGHNVICLCCQCCCSQVRGRTRWENPEAIAPSNFVARSDDSCVMCGECVGRCVFGAISLSEDLGRAEVNADKCVGCGVCAVACPEDALRLERVEREKPFRDARELMKTVAIENREE